MIDQLTLYTSVCYFYRASDNKPGPAASKAQYNSTEHQPEVNLGQKAKTERQAPSSKAELSPLALRGLFPSLLPLNLSIKLNIFLQE